MLIDNDENDEEEEDEMKENNKVLKRATDKGNKSNKKQEKDSKNQKCESKARERKEDDGISYEDELKKARNRKRNSGKFKNLCANMMLTYNGKVIVLKKDMRH